MRRSRPLLAALATVALLAGGCTGDDDAPADEVATPDGWQRVELDGLELAVPDDFDRNDAADGDAEAVFQLDTGTPDTSAGVAVYRASPTTTEGDTVRVPMYIANTVVTGVALEDFDNDPATEVEVPGAIEAESMRWRYQEAGLEEPLVSDGLFLRTEDAIFEVRYVRAGERDDDVVDQLFGSVRATG